MSEKKGKPAVTKELQARVDAAPATANGTAPIQAPNLIEQFRQKFQAAETAKQEATKALEARLEAIDKEREEILSMLEEIQAETGAGDPRPRPRRERSGGVAVMRNDKTLEDYAWDALKKAGEKGATRRGAAQAALKAGFVTPIQDPEDFSKSFYVSGINKLMKKGWATSFNLPGERESRYKLTKEGLARKGEK